jgi:hypothetical protein
MWSQSSGGTGFRCVLSFAVIHSTMRLPFIRCYRYCKVINFLFPHQALVKVKYFEIRFATNVTNILAVGLNII